MGQGMAHRLISSYNPLVVYDIQKKSHEGVQWADSPQEFIGLLQTPRTILLSLPTETIDQLLHNLSLTPGDIILDFGNSWYKDSQRRAKELQERGISFLDVGISGGTTGAKEGACIMVGGKEPTYKKLEPLFAILACEKGYRYVGESGAGHLVKAYHNALEYAIISAIAQSTEILQKRDEIIIPISDLFDLWNHGSIVQSRLLQDASHALQNDISKISGSVNGRTQEEIALLLEETKQKGFDFVACASALQERMDSLHTPFYRGQIINAMRFVFGGHKEWDKSS